MDSKYVKGNIYFNKESSEKIKKYEYLDKDIETDVVIIGGGATGAIQSYYLSKNNISNVVLEKSRIGFGSTSVSTALLQYELDNMVNDLEEVLDKQDIGIAYQLGQKALLDLEDIIKENGNNCDYMKVDSVLYSNKKEDEKILEYEYNFRKDNGFEVKFVDETQELFPFDVKAGIIAKNGGAKINPYLFTHQLLNFSTKQHAKVYENTEVQEIDYNNDDVIIKTGYGNFIKCKKVIIATGYDTDMFTDRNFGTKSITYNIVTEPAENPYKIKDYIIRDASDPYNYLRTTADGRYILGGEDLDVNDKNYSDKTANQKYDVLEQRLKNWLPLEKIKTEYKYCGLFCSTKDDLGFIGQDPKHKNLWYALGYGANGILYAILAGQMLVKLYNGEVDENMRLFKVNRFDG